MRYRIWLAAALAGLVGLAAPAAGCESYWTDEGWGSLQVEGSTATYVGDGEGDEGTCQVTWENETAGTLTCESRDETPFSLTASDAGGDDPKEQLLAWGSVFQRAPC